MLSRTANYFQVIINSDTFSRSYDDLYLGVTFFGGGTEDTGYCTRYSAVFVSVIPSPDAASRLTSSLRTVIAVSYAQPSPGHASFHTDAQQLRQSKFQCCRPARVEQFTAATTTRHELSTFQASTENISIRELVNHGAL